MRHALAASLCLTLAACAGSIDDTADQPLDPEFGTVNWERADDNSVVRPGTPEAAAVLAYVNKAVPDDAAGRAFLTEMDTELNVLAARSIAEARSGADGRFGTADDVTFADLIQLDEVRYVGRTALMQLFVLAEANGYFQTTASCEDVLGNRAGSTVQVTTLAELIEIENSRCDHFTGSLWLDISANVLPAHRELKALDHVKRIEGTLTISGNRGLDSLTFRGLEYLGRLNTAQSAQYAGSLRGNVHFPVLTKADRITNGLDWSMEALEELHTLATHNYSGTFPALRKVELLEPSAFNLRGFDALEEAGEINIEAKGSTEGFSSLREVQAFRTNSPTFAGLPSLETAEIMVLGGSAATFPKLRSVGDLSSSRTDFTGEFPVLERANNVDIKLGRFPFPALTEVTGNFVLRGTGQSGASALETVGGAFESSTSFSDFAALEEVGGDFSLYHSSGVWDGLNALELVGGDALIHATGGTMQGLDNLQSLPKKLELAIGRNTRVEGLSALEVTGQLWFQDQSSWNASPLPSLVLVDGWVHIEGDGDNTVRGLDALDSINGDLYVQYVSSFDGLSALESVGGSTISLPRGMDSAERDQFLNQLQQFSGNIEYN